MSEELDTELDDLKAEAASLNIKHSAAIGADKLREKIDAYYESQETSGPALEKLVEMKEVEEEETSDKRTDMSEKTRRLEKRRKRHKEARKTRVVIIIDNDQRQNNHTSTCSVNCSNEYFDLGTVILPLGEKVEVAQGHIKVLKNVIIPIHTRHPKTGLSITKSRPRYSISYEE